MCRLTKGGPPPLFKMVVVTSTHTKSHWLELLFFFSPRFVTLKERERKKNPLLSVALRDDYTAGFRFHDNTQLPPPLKKRSAIDFLAGRPLFFALEKNNSPIERHPVEAHGCTPITSVRCRTRFDRCAPICLHTWFHHWAFFGKK